MYRLAGGNQSKNKKSASWKKWSAEPEKLTYDSKRDKRPVTMDLFKGELNAINYGQYSGTDARRRRRKGEKI
jgi:hypothetical protein